MPQSQKAVKLRLSEFDRETAKRGLDTDAKRCRYFGFSQTTMSQIRNKDIPVGGRVIHKIMTGLELPYLRLFEEVELDDTKDVA